MNIDPENVLNYGYHWCDGCFEAVTTERLCPACAKSMNLVMRLIVIPALFGFIAVGLGIWWRFR